MTQNKWSSESSRMDPTAPPGGGKDYYDDEVGISMVGLKSKKVQFMEAYKKFKG